MRIFERKTRKNFPFCGVFFLSFVIFGGGFYVCEKIFPKKVCVRGGSEIVGLEGCDKIFSKKFLTLGSVWALWVVFSN